MQAKKTIAYIIAAILCLCYIAKPQPHAWNAILCHANIFHLLANIIAIWSLYTCTINNFPAWKIIPACYVVGTLAFILSPTPAVGFSAFIFALLGFIGGRFTTRHNSIVMLIFCALSFLPGIAAFVHIFSLITAFFLYKLSVVVRFLWNNV